MFMLVTQTSLRLLSGLVVFPRWQYRLRFSNAERIHAGNASLASVSQWHRSVFTLSMKASLGLRSGISASSCWQCWPRFGFAVASFTLAMRASLRQRSGIAASSRWQCEPRFGFAVASQRLHAGYSGLASALQLHRRVFMLAMRASLGIAEASQRLHAVNVGFASASQWCFSVFTLAI